MSHLIRGAALEAIADGTEQITRKLLATIPVDHNSQADGVGPAEQADAAA